MKWSIIVPVLRWRPALSQCLASVDAQLSYKHQKLVVAMCDEPDVENTAKTCGFSVAHVESKGNLSLDWNQALSHAEGDAVHLLHDDDYVNLGFYSTCERGYDASADVCSTGYCNVEDGRVTFANAAHEDPGAMSHWKWVEKIATGNCMQAVAVTMRRSSLPKDPYRADVFHCCDWELYARMSIGGAVWWSDPSLLATYRVHPASMTGKSPRVEVFDHLRRTIGLIRGMLPDALREKCEKSSRYLYGAQALGEARAYAKAGDLAVAADLSAAAIKLFTGDLT